MILFILLVGCRQGGGDARRLVELDSLIAAAPDSAAALLAAVPADSLPTAGDRAYHALLLTQARYKAYIPLDSTSLDTINLAVAHYADGADGDKLTRSLLYKGCVMEELGRPDSAMYYYKAAEDHATQSGDTYHRGYALMRMAWLFQSKYAVREAIETFSQSLKCMLTVHSDYDVLYAMQELGNLYMTVDTDSAMHFIDESIKLSLQLDSCDYGYSIVTKAVCCFKKARYKDCIKYGKQAIELSHDRPALFRACNWTAQAYAKLGEKDSGAYYLDMSPLPGSKEDTVLYLSTMAAMGVRDSVVYHLKAGNVADTLLNNTAISRLNGAVELYESEAAQHSIAQFGMQTRVLIVSSIIIIVFLGLVLFRVFRTHRAVVKRHCEVVELKDDEIQAKELQLRKKTQKIRSHKKAINECQAAIRTKQQEIDAKCAIIEQQQIIIRSKEQKLQADKKLLEEQHAIIAAKEQAINEISKRVESLKDAVNKVRESESKIKEAYIGEFTSLRSDVISLIEQLKLQTVTFHKGLYTAKCSRSEVVTAIRNMLNDSFCETFMRATFAAYPKLVLALEGNEQKLSPKDFMIVCMHLAGFPNAVIRDYLGIDRDHSVTNRKRDLAIQLGVKSLDSFRDYASA